MEVYYLIDAEAVREGVKLTLFKPSSGVWEEVLDQDYKPYFFIPYPLSPRNREIVQWSRATTKGAEKVDLFTGLRMKVIRVEIEDYSNSKWISDRFEKTWEGEVPYVLGYAYDHDLTFGAHSTIKKGRVVSTSKISEDIERRFKERFRELKSEDPEKYGLLERWFTLCSQPVPEIQPERLGMDRNVDPQKYYVTFILSRVANIPVPKAYKSQSVSTWIRSILHNYLRTSNILIPSSRELKRSETTRSVQGALTFFPEPGVHFNTVVMDFESLYPSLIDTQNLSYETINCAHEECQKNKVPGLEHYICKEKRGVYSLLVGSMRDLRVHWFKPLARDKTIPAEERRLAEATSKLLKLILVSSYGVTIRINGLSRPSLAESITAYGRHSLQTTWGIAKEGGIRPIYGDTDSLFLDDPTEEQVKWLIKTVKEQLKLDLAVDEQYAVCILPHTMKAYFGVRLNGSPDIKGVTAIKSNSPSFIRNVFLDCVKELANVKNQADFDVAKKRIQRIVRNAIVDLKVKKTHLRDLKYSVRLHENPQEKMKGAAIHQPYQCAFQLIDSGKSTHKGDIVNFVKVKPFTYKGRTFTVRPFERVKDFREVNIEDYVRNLITAFNQTFKLFDLRFSEDGEGPKVLLSDFI